VHNTSNRNQPLIYFRKKGENTKKLRTPASEQKEQKIPHFVFVFEKGD
jgi:hypothetical protein